MTKDLYFLITIISTPYYKAFLGKGGGGQRHFRPYFKGPSLDFLSSVALNGP